MSLAKTAGVFHLRSPAGKYMMNYSTAEVACKAEGATLATLSQLSDAQQVNQMNQITRTKCNIFQLIWMKNNEHLLLVKYTLKIYLALIRYCLTIKQSHDII